MKPISNPRARSVQVLVWRMVVGVAVLVWIVHAAGRVDAEETAHTADPSTSPNTPAAAAEWRSRTQDAGAQTKKSEEDPMSAIQWKPTLLVQLAVTDLDRAIRFYRDVLGLELESRDDELQWARIKSGIEGVTFGLGVQERVGGSGTVSLNLGVDDIDGARALLESRGVEFLGETVRISPGWWRLRTSSIRTGTRSGSPAIPRASGIAEHRDQRAHRRSLERVSSRERCRSSPERAPA